MAVLMTAEVPGQTREGYQATVDVLREGIVKAPGFIMHMSAPSEDGWTVMEVWDRSRKPATGARITSRPRCARGSPPVGRSASSTT